MSHVGLYPSLLINLRRGVVNWKMNPTNIREYDQHGDSLAN
jgi:hypothetical protein